MAYYLLVNTGTQYTTTSATLTAPSTDGSYTYSVEACNASGCSSAGTTSLTVSASGQASATKLPSGGVPSDIEASGVARVAATELPDRASLQDQDKAVAVTSHDSQVSRIGTEAAAPGDTGYAASPMLTGVSLTKTRVQPAAGI